MSAPPQSLSQPPVHGVDPPAPHDQERARQSPPARLGALALAMIVGSLLVCVYAVHAQMPVNAVTLPHEDTLRPSVRLVLPQGWSFFTRSPREADFVAFSRGADGRWRSSLRAPHAEPRNAFGLARASRAQGVEVGLLTGLLRDTDWQDCRGDPAGCLDRADPVRAANPALLKTLCGDVGLVQRPPVPWAWSRAGDVTMPSVVARLELSC